MLSRAILLLATVVAPLAFAQTPSATDENATIAEPEKVYRSKVRAEFVELGVTFGVVNIENFTSEFLAGANLTFRATEDFFLQVNYVQASDASLSSAEKRQGRAFDGDDRDFTHYDLLVGYNLFQGEFFTGGATANLSALYVVAGVGDTEFGGESRFTYTVGLGYQVAFNRRYIVRFDMRDYLYESSLLTDDNTTNNIQLSAGISYLF